MLSILAKLQPGRSEGPEYGLGVPGPGLLLTVLVDVLEAPVLSKGGRHMIKYLGFIKTPTVAGCLHFYAGKGKQ